MQIRPVRQLDLGLWKNLRGAPNMGILVQENSFKDDFFRRQLLNNQQHSGGQSLVHLIVMVSVRAPMLRSTILLPLGNLIELNGWRMLKLYSLVLLAPNLRQKVGKAMSH